MQISEPAEYIILGLLKKHPMHGYEMFQQIEESALHQILHLEMSQMYAYLKKLEKLEYIETRLTAQGARPPRKVHYLTTPGEATFMQWLTMPVEKPRDIRILFLIKLYFIRYLLPDKTVTLITQQIVACQRFLQHMEALQEATSESKHTTRERDDDLFFNHIVLRSRMHQTRALLDWLHELQRDTLPTESHNNIQ